MSARFDAQAEREDSDWALLGLSDEADVNMKRATMSLESFLIKHRVYCELCRAPIPATKVVQIRRRPQWPETKTVVVCDAHWRANSPIEAGLRTKTK